MVSNTTTKAKCGKSGEYSFAMGKIISHLDDLKDYQE